MDQLLAGRPFPRNADSVHRSRPNSPCHWRRLCTAVGLAIGASLYAASDAAAQTTLPVVDEPSLRNAIRTVSAAFAQGTAGGPYTIDLQNDITLTRSLPSVRTASPGDGSAWVTILGNGHQIDANQTGRVLVIGSGIVSIDNLRIVDARARGGNGGDSHRGGSGGGGLGAGAAIFVNAGAVLHTTSVTIENADAIGGNGGAVVTQPGPNSTSGGGGGGGLNGNGGMTSSASIFQHNGQGGGGGGGYLGTGGANTSTTQGAGGGGGGGDEGAGGAVIGHGGGGGGGAAGPGGESWEFGGGGGGGKTAAGDTNDGPFAAAGGVEGGQGGAQEHGGSDGGPTGGGGGAGAFGSGPGGGGGLLGGGGGGGQVGLGGKGGAGGGGGGGGGARAGGKGGEFGGGGGGGEDGMGGDGGLGGGGGGGGGMNFGAGDTNDFGGRGGFGGGGGGGSVNDPGGPGGAFGGEGRRTGGGGAALGGGIYVHEGGTLTFGGAYFFNGTFGVTPGVGGSSGTPANDGTSGQAFGKIFYLTGGPSESSVTFDSTGGVRLIPGDDAIAGDGSFGTDGGGVLLIDGDNSGFTGTVRLAGNPGVLRVEHAQALGAATVIGHGGGLGASGAGGPITLANPIVLDRGLTIYTLQPLTLTGSITGFGWLEMKSPGQTLTLTNVYTASGAVFVNDGTLRVEQNALPGFGAGSDAVVVASLGTLETTGVVDMNRPLIVNGGTVTVSGAGELRVNESLLAADTFTKNGTGTLTLNGSTAFGGTASLLLAGGIVQGPATAFPSSIATTPSSEVRFVQGTTGIYAGSVTGAGGVLKTGPGTLLLTGQHSYNGMTTVAQGTLRLSGLSTALQSDISNSGTVEFLQVEYGTYSKSIFGTGTLRKIGSGTLRLTNTLDHQGATVIDGGALQMDGTVSLSTFSVNTGSTLAGNGSVRVANVQAGATVSPGAIGTGGVSAPGVLTADIVSMQAGATLAIDVNGPNAGAGYDRLASITRVELNGATLHVTIGGSPIAFTPAPGSVFVIVSNAVGTFAGLPEGAAVQAGARRFRITYAGGDGNDVALVAEDAPSITGLIDRTTDEDVTLGPLAFNVDDDLSAAGTLIVSATSSNQSVVTNAGVTVGVGGSGGSGGARTLTLTPIANAFGTTTITVRVEDEAGLSTQQTFAVTVTAVNDVPTITAIPNQAAAEDGPPLVLPFVVSDVESSAGALTVSSSSNSTNAALLPAGSVTFGGSGASRTVTIAPAAAQSGTATVTITVSDGTDTRSTSFTLLVIAKPTTPGTPESTVYYLAEGATGTFFDTDLLLANPQTVEAPVTIEFLRADGVTVTLQRTLAPLSRTTVRVDDVAGLESTALSTRVTSTDGVAIVVERTMRWDASGYGAHTEKATAGAAAEWYFAEGAQGFFSTYLLLVNPHATANVAHVTWLREGEPALQRDYQLPPSSRVTIDAGTEPDLVNRSFGARVLFDQPGAAERAMYFGASPLWSGGHASAGATAPSTHWLLAEGATGSYFTTFVLIANPNDAAADLTLTYLPLTGSPVTTTKKLEARQRMTINIANEDPSLASAAVSTDVVATAPVVVERAQYWPNPSWYEAHNSFGVTASAPRWALAEGRVGGSRAEQTYILLANAGTEPSDVTLTFLRENGAPVVVKTFNVPASSRFNVAVSGPGSDVPELADESFGARIDATRPIVVERSVYSNANGVTWAAGTNATATPLTP